MKKALACVGAFSFFAWPLQAQEFVLPTPPHVLNNQITLPSAPAGATWRPDLIPHVSSTAALTTMSVSSMAAGTAIWQDGYYAVGDMPPVRRVLQLSPCAISTSGGVASYGDGGSQIPTAGNAACWVGSIPTRFSLAVFGGKPGGTFDNLSAFQNAITYAISQTANGTSTNISLDNKIWGLSCTITLPGTGPSVGGSPTAYVGGVGIVGPGKIVGTSNFCFNPTPPAEPVPVLAVTNGSYHAVLRDFTIDANLLGSCLLDTPGNGAGGGTLKTTIEHIECVHFFNPAYPNEAAYDPNYSTAYTRLFYNYSGTTGNARFVTGDTVKGCTSNATATIYNAGNNEVTLTGGSGTFYTSPSLNGPAGETIVDTTIGAASDCTSGTPTGPVAIVTNAINDSNQPASWSSATAYTTGSVVTYQNTLYYAPQASANQTPSGSSAYWTTIGSWSNSTAYATGAVVTRVSGSNLNVFIAIQGGTGQDPNTATTYWNQIASFFLGFGPHTIYLAPSAATNPYRPYGFRMGTQATASPSLASSQTYVRDLDLKQYLPGDAGYSDETKQTGICAWFSTVDVKAGDIQASSCRKPFVVDGSTDTFDKLHGFPNGPTTRTHEWTDIEVNQAANTFINTYLDHGQVMLNDPRNIFIGGRAFNVALPQTPIAAAFSIGVPAGCSSPCDLGNRGPLVISGFWLKNYGASNLSGFPQLVKAWAPVGTTQFTGMPPLELTGEQGDVYSNTKDHVLFGNAQFDVEHLYSGATSAMSCYSDANTAPSGQQCWGSVGTLAGFRSNGNNMTLLVGNGAPTATPATNPGLVNGALYWNKQGTAASGNHLYVYDSATSAWTAIK